MVVSAAKYGVYLGGDLHAVRRFLLCCQVDDNKFLEYAKDS